MATYLIQVKDGANTVGVIDPITFKNAIYYKKQYTIVSGGAVNFADAYYIAINSNTKNFALEANITGAAPSGQASIAQTGDLYFTASGTPLAGNSSVLTQIQADYVIQFSSSANAQAALAQIYTDLNAYYNA